jgi:hypothetical protein
MAGATRRLIRGQGIAPARCPRVELVVASWPFSLLDEPAAFYSPQPSVQSGWGFGVKGTRT